LGICRSLGGIPDTHPAKQGLKLIIKEPYLPFLRDSRHTSSKTRIETKKRLKKQKMKLPIPDTHPAKQGLKQISIK